MPSGMARPKKKTKDQKLTFGVATRWTESEREKIKQMAADRGLSLNGWIREKCGFPVSEWTRKGDTK